MNKKGSAIASLFLIIVTGAVIQIMPLIRALATENGNFALGDFREINYQVNGSFGSMR